MLQQVVPSLRGVSGLPLLHDEPLLVHDVFELPLPDGELALVHGVSGLRPLDHVLFGVLRLQFELLA